MSEQPAEYNLTMTEQLRRARNFDELADKVEPFAQSMATLADQYSQGMMANLKLLQDLTESMNKKTERMDSILGHIYDEAGKLEQVTKQAINKANTRPPSIKWWQMSTALAIGLVVGLIGSWNWLHPTELQQMYQADGVRINHSWRTATPEQRKQINEIMGWKDDE